MYCVTKINILKAKQFVPVQSKATQSKTFSAFVPFFFSPASFLGEELFFLFSAFAKNFGLKATRPYGLYVVHSFFLFWNTMYSFSFFVATSSSFIFFSIYSMSLWSRRRLFTDWANKLPCGGYFTDLERPQKIARHSTRLFGNDLRRTNGNLRLVLRFALRFWEQDLMRRGAI